MKKEYTENIPAHTVHHKLVVCDNSDCNSVIKDNGEQISDLYIQIGSQDENLLDACSERCAKILENKRKKFPQKL